MLTVTRACGCCVKTSISGRYDSSTTLRSTSGIWIGGW